MTGVGSYYLRGRFLKLTAQFAFVAVARPLGQAAVQLVRHQSRPYTQRNYEIVQLINVLLEFNVQQA